MALGGLAAGCAVAHAEPSAAGGTVASVVSEAGEAGAGASEGEENPLPNFRVTERHLATIVERLASMEADLKAFGRGLGAQEGMYGPKESFPVLPADTRVAKHLTSELYTQLRDAGHTRNFWDVNKAVQAAADAAVLSPQERGALFGVEMGDEESYDLLAPLLAPMLREYHGFDMDSGKQEEDTDASGIRDAAGEVAAAIVSSELSVARNLRNLCFAPNCPRGERRKIARMLRTAFGATAGTFEDRGEMSAARVQEVRAKGMLFREPTVVDVVRGVARDWPDARALYVSEDEQTTVWVNAEDHVRVTVKRPGSAVPKVFSEAFLTLRYLREYLQVLGEDFAIHPRLGALTASPANAGTAMTATINAKLPLLSARPDLARFCSSKGVRVNTALSPGSNALGVVALSNVATLGVTEVQAVNSVLDCLRVCVELEAQLRAGSVAAVDAALAAGK